MMDELKYDNEVINFINGSLLRMRSYFQHFFRLIIIIQGGDASASPPE